MSLPNQAGMRVVMLGFIASPAMFVEKGDVTYWWPRPDSDKPLEKTTAQIGPLVGAQIEIKLMTCGRFSPP